jgi:hypothetical protein
VGFGLVAFVEYRDTSFRSRDDVTAVLSLPVLAQIPLMTTPADRRRLARRRFVLSAVTVIAIAGTGTIFWWLGVFNGLLRWN